MLPVIERDSVACLDLKDGQFEAGVVDDVAAGSCCRGEDPVFGGQDVGAGVDGGVVAGVNTRTVPAPEHGGFVHGGVGVVGQGDAVCAEGGGDDAVGQCRGVGLVGVAQQAGDFGADVVDLPGRAACGHRRDDRGGLLLHPFLGHRRSTARQGFSGE